MKYDICLPFHILSYYIKNQNCLLSPVEKTLLESVVVLAFNSFCIDAKFVFYLINDSEFIEIVMSVISSNLENLPQKLVPLDATGSFNLPEQLHSQSK